MTGSAKLINGTLTDAARYAHDIASSISRRRVALCRCGSTQRRHFMVTPTDKAAPVPKLAEVCS